MTRSAPDDSRPGFLVRTRTLLLTGVLVIGPTAVTVWVLFRLLAGLDYHRAAERLHMRAQEKKALPAGADAVRALERAAAVDTTR